MHIREVAVLAGYAAVATTTSANGSAIDLSSYLNSDHFGLSATLNCLAVTGATATLDIKVQESDDTTSADFTDIAGAVFTELSTSTASAGAFQRVFFKTGKRYIRFATTAAGTSPSYTVATQVQVLTQLV